MARQYIRNIVQKVERGIQICYYHGSLTFITQELLTSTNQFLERHSPWKLVKTDKDSAKKVLFQAVQQLQYCSDTTQAIYPS